MNFQKKTIRVEELGEEVSLPFYVTWRVVQASNLNLSHEEIAELTGPMAITCIEEGMFTYDEYVEQLAQEEVETLLWELDGN